MTPAMEGSAASESVGSLTLNGEAHPIGPEATLALLLEGLGLEPAQVALERNGEMVRRADWHRTPALPGDVIEVVTLVGGG